jgi:FixJ family two-component response regulator
MMNDVPLISVIDDDRFVRDATASLLRSLGYVVMTFSSAEDFLRWPDFHVSWCIISDVAMAGMTGLDLQNHLLANGHNIPIIFITALDSDDVRTTALNAGAYGVLTKPYSEESLIDCLTRALDAYRRRH